MSGFELLRVLGIVALLGGIAVLLYGFAKNSTSNALLGGGTVAGLLGLLLVLVGGPGSAPEVKKPVAKAHGAPVLAADASPKAEELPPSQPVPAEADVSEVAPTELDLVPTTDVVAAADIVTAPDAVADLAPAPELVADAAPEAAPVELPAPTPAADVAPELPTPAADVAEPIEPDEVGLSDAEREARRAERHKRRNNKPPVADAGGDRETKAGEKIKFNGEKSTDPDGNTTIKSYRWDLGDGSLGRGMRIDHTYRDPGEYVVTLTVEDEYGASEQDFIKVVVSE